MIYLYPRYYHISYPFKIVANPNFLDVDMFEDLDSHGTFRRTTTHMAWVKSQLCTGLFLRAAISGGSVVLLRIYSAIFLYVKPCRGGSGLARMFLA
jgi:hypothetical protein